MFRRMLPVVLLTSAIVLCARIATGSEPITLEQAKQLAREAKDVYREADMACYELQEAMWIAQYDYEDTRGELNAFPDCPTSPISCPDLFNEADVAAALATQKETNGDIADGYAMYWEDLALTDYGHAWEAEEQGYEEHARDLYLRCYERYLKAYDWLMSDEPGGEGTDCAWNFYSGAKEQWEEAKAMMDQAAECEHCNGTIT